MTTQHELSIETNKLVQFSRLCVATNAWKWMVANDKNTNRATSDEAFEKSFDAGIPSLIDVRAAYRPLRDDSSVGRLFPDVVEEDFDRLHAALLHAEEHLSAAESELHTNSSCFIANILERKLNHAIPSDEHELALHILSHYAGSQLVAAGI